MEPSLTNTKLDIAAADHDNPDFVIDLAAWDDLESIVQIDSYASGKHKPEFWRDCYDRQANDPNFRFLVAKSGGEVAGFAIGTIKTWEFGAPTCGWVETLLVAPGFRERGIGTRLFDAVLAHFQAHGIRTVRTILNIDEHALMSFFRTQGMSAGPFIELEMQSE